MKTATKPEVKVANATTTSKKKVTDKKSEVIKGVTPTNKSKLIETVLSNREVKYIYPVDVVDTLSRKSWRQKVRNKLDKLERDMLRITDKESKEYKRAKRVYSQYANEVTKVE